MGFVDEHYSRLLRALVANSQEIGAQQVETSGTSSPDSEGVDKSSLDRLAQRSFDISTQILSIQMKTTSLESETEGLFSSLQDGQQQQPQRAAESTGSSVRVPSLASVASDLQLICEASGGNESSSISAKSQSQTNRATQLVLISAVAALHAHTVQQLLDTVLPLSIDVDYWNSQDGGILTLTMYLVQSLPWRLYEWGCRVTAAAVKMPEDRPASVSQIMDSVRRTLSSRQLFPDVTMNASDADIAQEECTAFQVLKVPRSVNIMSLTQREIRFKISKLVGAQNKIAAMIGMLSQVSTDGSLSPNQSPPTMEIAITQIVDILRSMDSSESMSDIDVLTPQSGTVYTAQLAGRLAERIQTISTRFTHQLYRCRRPSLVERSWILAIVLTVGVRHLSSYIAGHQDDFKEWIRDGAVTLQNYISQYILEPLRSAYETIRYGKHTYAVVTEESLLSDFRSLEDMVVGFARRFGNIDAADVRRRVEAGDLSDVMSVYAREMQKPFKNAVFGDLVEAMLIQVQKVKVDVGQTMAALDKLLKSNELNFLLLSTVPATFSLYVAGQWLLSKVSWWVGGGSRFTVSSIRVVMRDIDRLLNTKSRKSVQSGDLNADAVTQGQLICYTHYLRHHAQLLPNAGSSGRIKTASGWVYTMPHTRSMFLQDIRDIESASFTSTQKRNVLERMYRSFSFLK
ncbi:Nuclear control of ATPase protein 2 [Coemansia sp. RSA 2603]|nr:Nuclear control of ATPase protein 2 [Coemansia sp. RSA 2603]